MATNKYFVCNENTLCYHQIDSTLKGVLHGSVIRGGRDWKNGAFSLSMRDSIRPATALDFADYRVQLPPDHPEHPRYAEYTARRGV